MRFVRVHCSFTFQCTISCRVMMSVRKESHYNINKTLLSWIGQWPHQSALQKFLWSSNVIFAVGSQMYLQTCGLLAAWTDWDLVIECASPILIDVLCLIKFINCLFNARKMKMLLERMQSAWNLILTDKQIEILRSYTSEGYKLTRTYAVTMYSATFMYMTLPHVPALIALISNKNETVQRALLYHVEQVVDVDKYYYLVLFHSYYGTFFLMTLPIAADSMFLVYVQHACGMFSLIGHQLENVQDDNLDVNIRLSNDDDEAYKKITDSIVKHKDTLQFAELLGNTYSTSFLVQTGLNVAVITFSGVQAVIYLDRTEEALRFGMTGLTVSFHFLFLSLPGQKLLDHSLQVNDSIYYSNWYTISIRSRQLLDLMLIRSRVPSQITAGKIYTMSLQNFSSVMQAAMSYFTVLTSLR